MGAQPLTAQQSTAAPLPIFAHTAKAFRRALSDTVINWRSIGQIILTDPALVLQTLRLLNTGDSDNHRFEVSGISQALMLLGINRVQRLALGVPVVERSLNRVSVAGYSRAASRAFHAAFQARNWAQWHNDIAPEEIFIATLLHSVPELLLWMNAPDQMQLLRQRIYKEGMSPQEAEQITLGESLQHIGQKSASDLQQPPIMQDMLDPEKADAPRVQIVNLALQLANWVEFGWHTQQVSHIIDNVAHYLNKHPDQTTRIIHRNAVNIAHDFQLIPVRPAATLLALIPTDDDRLLREEFSIPSSEKLSTVQNTKTETRRGSVTTAPPAPERGKVEAQGESLDSTTVTERAAGAITVEQTPKRSQRPVPVASEKSSSSEVVCLSPQPTLFARAVQQLEAGKGKLAAEDIIRIAVEGMRNGIGFHRIVYATLPANRSHLEAQSITGAEYDPAFNMFRVKLSGHDLFSRLLEKPSSIWINDENRAKYWKSIPSELKVLIKTNSFCIMSVHLHDNPVGLFYVDRYSPNCPIDKQSFTLFRHLGLLTAKCLAECHAVKK